jgi:hypothetical protein
MVLEFNFGLKEQNTRVNGRRISLMVKEPFIFQTVIRIRVIG